MFPVPRFPVPRFLLPRYQRPLNTQHCIYMSHQKSGNEQLIKTVKLSAKHAYSQLTYRPQRPSEDHRWSGWHLYNQTKTSVRRVRCFSALSSGLTPPTSPPPMKNARRAAAASHKTTQRRRRPPVGRRTALVSRCRAWQDLSAGRPVTQVGLSGR